MLYFCLQSLFRKYGWQFFRHVALPHPIRTAKAVLHASRRDFTGDSIATSKENPPRTLAGPQSIVGVGFCLKPLDPPCPSGRFNHGCLYLERLLPGGITDVPACCRPCMIRQIGTRALNAGTSFYIMTSARDILFDLFLPALNERRFSSGLFVLCRYSFRPFAVGLLVSGVRGWLLPFEQGDCRDYGTWLRADRGNKDERTCLSEGYRKIIMELLGNAPDKPDTGKEFKRQGNILCPEYQGAG